MSAINELKAVLLGQDGSVSIEGSDEDRAIIVRTLEEIDKQFQLLAYEVLRLWATGLLDIDGKEFFDGDSAHLDFGGLHMEGIVRRAKSGEWELYADDDNHVGLLHNQGRIRKVKQEKE